jgi:hypothetical protein
VFRRGALARQLTSDGWEMRVVDVNAVPVSVSLIMLLMALIYSDVGQSIPQTIPVTPDPEYHSLQLA